MTSGQIVFFQISGLLYWRSVNLVIKYDQWPKCLTFVEIIFKFKNINIPCKKKTG